MDFSAKLFKRNQTLHGGTTGHAPETKDEDISPEERRKVIAEWLITWLKEGDASLAMH